MQLQSPLFYDGILRKNAKKFFTLAVKCYISIREPFFTVCGH